jgi:hypothetical protein
MVHLLQLHYIKGYFGDVWICSDQSNMQLTINLIYNATEEIVNAGNFPKIRFHQQ